MAPPRGIHAAAIFLTQVILFCRAGAAHNPPSGCPEMERRALLKIKAGLSDPSNRLSSWTGSDCCSWDGIGCDPSGHVVRLDLSNPQPFEEVEMCNPYCLDGNISSSLQLLQHLTYLDLSYNYLGGGLWTPIPPFIGSLKELKYVNLYWSGYSGIVPHELGNLSSLRYLNLSYNGVRSGLQLVIDDGQWLSGLTSLRYLSMSSVNLRNASNWVQALNTLPSIKEIDLSYCDIGGSIPPSLPLLNFTTLTILDLSYTNMNSSIPGWVFRITSLEYLNLRGNFLYGSIPVSVGNMSSLKSLDLSNTGRIDGGIPVNLGNICTLEKLDISGTFIGHGLDAFGEIFSGCIRSGLAELGLSGTSLTGYLPDSVGGLRNLKSLDISSNLVYGPIPQSLGGLASLQELKVYGNELNGSVAESIGRLSQLVHMDLSNNSLRGVLSEVHFANLTRLKHLDISYNSLLALRVNSDWIPPFQLEYVNMGSCKLGPKFRAWLQTQANLSELDISNARISDVMPSWFEDISTRIFHLNLSRNEISGTISISSDLGSEVTLVIDLSSNHFEGPLPHFPANTIILDLSTNSFSGPIPPSIGDSIPNLLYFFLSANELNGSIPSSMCNMTSLEALDLSRNYLSGEIPDCWIGNSWLEVVDFSNNNLSGRIPDSICSQSRFSLHLGNNSLTGEIPRSMKKCTSIVVLDLGHNKLTGNIPNWLGESLSSLIVLSLRSNKFAGNLPPTLCHLAALKVLDLSNNNLSGRIPTSFGNFTAMMSAQDKMPEIYVSSTPYYIDSLNINIKGRDLKFDKLLLLVIAMDLSENSLVGNIPGELATLFGLQSLNLSGNHLTGGIIAQLGNLRQLESLDLSKNELSGAIPLSLSSLNFLESLNLSCNDLSGKIPSGGQLDTFVDPSIYIGNYNLCGPPLAEKCPGEKTNTSDAESNKVDGEDGNELRWFYISLEPGFIVGLLVVCVTLLFKRKWRFAYFSIIDNMYDRFCGATSVDHRRSGRRVSKRN